MASAKQKNSCESVGRWLTETLSNRLSAPSAWLQRHVASCPRCRRLVAGGGRVGLGMLMIKTQTHRNDLLMRANRRAIRMISRRVRDLPAAERLRHAVPRPGLRERLGRFTQSVAHAAACLAVLLFMRMGIFASMTRIHDEGSRVVEQYYARNLDQDLLDEIL